MSTEDLAAVMRKLRSLIPHGVTCFIAIGPPEGPGEIEIITNLGPVDLRAFLSEILSKVDAS